jgi:predicted ester cyclase
MSRHVVLAVALLAVAVAAAAETTPDQNVALAEAMFEAVNQREFDRLDDLIAADVVRHCAATPGVNVRSLPEFKAFLAADLAACPDAVQEINVIFGCGDKVAVHATYRGTQTGPMGPFAASGKVVEIPYIGILRVADGRIVEMWAEWDNLNALTQLGHFPSQ